MAYIYISVVYQHVHGLDFESWLSVQYATLRTDGLTSWMLCCMLGLDYVNIKLIACLHLQAKRATDEKHDTIANQVACIEAVADSASSTLDFASAALDEASDVELLAMYGPLSSRLHSLKNVGQAATTIAVFSGRPLVLNINKEALECFHNTLSKQGLVCLTEFKMAAVWNQKKYCPTSIPKVVIVFKTIRLQLTFRQTIQQYNDRVANEW